MNKVICKILGHFVWMVVAELIPIYAICSMVSTGQFGPVIGIGGLIAVLWIFGGIYQTMKNIHKGIAEYKKLKDTEKK